MLLDYFDMIPFGKQHIIPADIGPVVESLKPEFLTHGPVSPKFEKAYFGSGTKKVSILLTRQELPCVVIHSMKRQLIFEKL